MRKNKLDFMIDPEFQSQIPALTDDEFRQLEENILSAGEVISPLIIWGKTLVDGHNRHKILQRHPEISYSVRSIDCYCETCEDVLAWIRKHLLDADLSHTAKLLYTLLLDRATLSQKNNWIDAQGCIYVIYPLAHLAKDLGCCVSSVTRAFTELEKADLAERVHSGFSKPSRILLKVPHDTQNCTVTVCTRAQSDCAETHSMIAQKCTPNQRNKNNLKENHLIRTKESCLALGESQNVFLTEKEYKRLKADFTGLDSLIEQLSEYIQSTGRKYADHAATLRIWAKRQSAEKKATPGIPDYTFKEGESL